jgi:hypothetical protein
MFIIAIPLILVLLGLVIYQYGYVKIEEELASLEEAGAVKGKTLEKYVTLIAQKPQMEQKLASLNEMRKAGESRIIAGQTPAIATATLQNMVKGTVTGRAGTISSDRAEKPEDLGRFKIISVSIDAILPDPHALSDILFALETQTPYLIVRELDVRIRNYRDPRDLILRLKVSALTGGK